MLHANNAKLYYGKVPIELINHEKRLDVSNNGNDHSNLVQVYV